jgi:alkaline phosphatase
MLPEGMQGRHGEGKRTDGRNLIAELISRGYTIVYNRAELAALPTSVTKVLGVFNVEDTFYDMGEEQQQALGLPHYKPDAPTIAEMTSFALSRLEGSKNGFLMVVEEEGTDNLCNYMNASGCLEAYRRTDETFGVIIDHIENHPQTFMVTTSDSNANGMQIYHLDADTAFVPLVDPASGAPLDGRTGTNTRPFESAPDAEGRSFKFAVSWASGNDVGSGVLARGMGLNAAKHLPTTGIDNTDIYRMLYETLFEVEVD